MGLTSKNMKYEKEYLLKTKNIVENLILSGDILDNSLDHVSEYHYDADIRDLEKRRKSLENQIVNASSFDYGIDVRGMIVDTLLANIWDIATIAMDEADDEAIILQKTYDIRIGYGIFREYQNGMETTISECCTCTVVLGQKIIDGKSILFVKTAYPSNEESDPPLTYEDLAPLFSK